MRETFYRWRLKRAYIAWLSAGDGLDCGIALAQHIKPIIFADAMHRCQHWALKLRAMGVSVPAVPGEKDFT